MQTDSERWSDRKLQELRDEFQAHMRHDEIERARQIELHDAIFQKEDKDTNTPPGLLQLCVRMDERLRTIEIATDRQKRFIGGFIFAFTSVGFFFTDTAHKIFQFLRGV